MRVLFHTNQLGIRGTEIAMYDYADGNENILGNESFIIHDANSVFNTPENIQRFKDRFPNRVFSYVDKSEIDDYIEMYNIDVFYALKAGVNDGVISHKVKNCIHVVFSHNQPHGDVYSYVSKMLADRHNGIYVPHIVNPLPNTLLDFREFYHIPDDHIVFGRYGGYDTFDIPFVHETIKNILSQRDDVWFLFMNTEVFYDHERIINVPPSVELEYKSMFIKSCDAMLHARSGGETFGLACAEFNMLNKPVITWSGSNDNAHIGMLDDSAILYSNKDELFSIISQFSPTLGKKWHKYNDYCSEKVMRTFEKVFLL